jgi:hypothetical protein
VTLTDSSHRGRRPPPPLSRDAVGAPRDRPYENRLSRLGAGPEHPRSALNSRGAKIQVSAVAGQGRKGHGGEARRQGRPTYPLLRSRASSWLVAGGSGDNEWSGYSDCFTFLTSWASFTGQLEFSW